MPAVTAAAACSPSGSKNSRRRPFTFGFPAATVEQGVKSLIDEVTALLMRFEGRDRLDGSCDIQFGKLGGGLAGHEATRDLRPVGAAKPRKPILTPW